MQKKTDMQYCVLIVSSSEQFNGVVRNSMPQTSIGYAEVKKNVAAARRSVLERYVDIVVINTPLPDETGVDFAIDITEQCSASVLLVVPADMYQEAAERVTDRGVMVISKPMSMFDLTKAVRLLAAFRSRVHNLEKQVMKEHEKTEELRIVDRAKIILVEKKHMTEDDAHRYIGKQAMDNGVSRKRVAEGILEEYNE